MNPIRSLCLVPALLGSLASPALLADPGLKSAITFHASYDEGYEADFSKGDPVAYVKAPEGLVPLEESEEVLVVGDGGKYGGALWFPEKSSVRPSYKGEGIFDYNEKSWSATVSLWLCLTPDEDLEPGYCDPIQIVGDDTKKGFIFLEWSKDHNPRYFRYAIRPRIELWDPQGLGWEVLPEEKRPMVQLKSAPFSRDAWTHAVFTLENINGGPEVNGGALYLDGKLQGRIEKFDLTFGWDPASVMLVLGAAYVGYLDDVTVFNRALTADEIAKLHALDLGGLALTPP